MHSPELVFPDWPAPASVKAVTTTRIGGVSDGRHAALNLGERVGDRPTRVRENRRILARILALPAEPVWLRQVHGTDIVDAGRASPEAAADGSVSHKPGAVCAVLTADCLPVFLCDRAGTRVGLMHAGWRGLAAGVLAAGVARLSVPPVELLAWLGPAIGPDVYEVGDEVKRAFVEKDAACAAAFVATRPGHWLADLYALARRQLEHLGVTDIYGGGFCTFRDEARFFSYRRDGQQSGRMASLIWLEPSALHPKTR